LLEPDKCYNLNLGLVVELGHFLVKQVFNKPSLMHRQVVNNFFVETRYLASISDGAITSRLFHICAH